MIRKLTPSHVTLVVICVTVLATEATVGGIYLSAHGLQGGPGLVIIILSNAISGLIGFLGGRGTAPQSLPDTPEIPKLP